MNPVLFIVICLAGWLNRNQQEVVGINGDSTGSATTTLKITLYELASRVGLFGSECSGRCSRFHVGSIRSRRQAAARHLFSRCFEDDRSEIADCRCSGTLEGFEELRLRTIGISRLDMRFPVS
ncbi:MAG: hypothetical protein ACI9R3_004793 [Verrucomicrobiales bacterium]|jgi:hypothetical protein